jgi:intracellular sulfur oxidation DsrE/DsrF family protein
MFKNFLLILLLSLLLSATESEPIVKKVVYDLTTGDLKKLEKNLLSGIVAHKNHYEGKLQELEVRVVIHGDSYKFFMSDLNGTAYSSQKDLVKAKEELGKRLESLAKNYGVEFLVCEVGVKSRKLNPKAFYPFVEMVVNASVALIDAQYEGFGYLGLK